MTITKFTTMETGKTYETPLMVTEINEKTGKNGSAYLDVKLSDGDNAIIAKCFNMTVADFSAKVGEVLDFNISVEEYNGSPSYKITGFKPCNEDINKADFVISAPIPAKDMYDYIYKTLKNLENKDVSDLGCKIYEELKSRLMYWSAAKTMHHAYLSGLLYHTYRMVAAAEILSAIYPSCNRDLVICGCALHDIGKIKELSTDSLGNATYTIDGSLLNHSLIGIECVSYYANELGTDKEVLRNLKHIIASHHGELEYGAIVKPATIEAIIVSQIDYLDSRVEMFEEALTNVDAGSMTENYVAGVHLYNPNIQVKTNEEEK